MGDKEWRWFTVILAAVLLIVLALLFYGLIGGFRPGQARAGDTIVVALHPGNSTGQAMCDSLAVYGIEAVCPDGVGGHWNSGWAGSTSTRDDIRFLKDLTAGYGRVIVIGRSQGGMMALRWACADPRVVAVHTKSGALPRGGCRHRGAEVVMWHGARDKLVPLSGDSSLFPLGRTRRVFGGCVESKTVIDGGIEKAGCGFTSRVFPDLGHRGVPDGWGVWLREWIDGASYRMR